MRKEFFDVGGVAVGTIIQKADFQTVGGNKCYNTSKDQKQKMHKYIKIRGVSYSDEVSTDQWMRISSYMDKDDVESLAIPILMKVKYNKFNVGFISTSTILSFEIGDEDKIVDCIDLVGGMQICTLAYKLNFFHNMYYVALGSEIMFDILNEYKEYCNVFEKSFGKKGEQIIEYRAYKESNYYGKVVKNAFYSFDETHLPFKREENKDEENKDDGEEMFQVKGFQYTKPKHNPATLVASKNTEAKVEKDIDTTDKEVEEKVQSSNNLVVKSDNNDIKEGGNIDLTKLEIGDVKELPKIFRRTIKKIGQYIVDNNLTAPSDMTKDNFYRLDKSVCRDTIKVVNMYGKGALGIELFRYGVIKTETMDMIRDYGYKISKSIFNVIHSRCITDPTNEYPQLRVFSSHVNQYKNGEVTVEQLLEKMNKPITESYKEALKWRLEHYNRYAV